MTSDRRAPAIDAPDLPTMLVSKPDAVLDTDSSIEDTDLVGAAVAEDAQRVRLSGCRLRDASFTGGKVRHLEFEDVVIESSELSGATFDTATFDRVRFVRCRMSGFVAPQLVAHHTTFVECRLDGAWLRMAQLERCAFEDCDLGQADFYTARIDESRFVRCRLDESEWTDAVLHDVALHRSTFAGVRGASALRNCTISSDQLVELALPILASLGIVVDDDYLDGT